MPFFKIGNIRSFVGLADARGNALIFILIAILLLGTLTYAITYSGDQQMNFSDRVAEDEQIGRLLTYVGTVAGTLNQMVVAGAKADTLHTTLLIDAPGSVAYGTPPHTMNLYHPHGGGMSYQTASSGNPSNAAAYNYKISRGSIVEDVGPTDAAVGDILFTARIDSAAYCGRINWLLRADATVPTLDDTDFTNLFDNGLDVTIAAANCAGCVGLSQLCVSNASANAWGYYAVLFPG